LTRIAGVGKPRASKGVENMLRRLQYLDSDRMEVYERETATLGVVWSKSEEELVHKMRESGYVSDTSAKGHFVRVEMKNGNLTFLRDEIGVVPLYYGKTADGSLCFASEVKALLPITNEINELSPASYFDGERIRNYGTIELKQPVDWGVEEIAMELRDAIVDSVESNIRDKSSVGAWLTGDLNSSIISSIAGKYAEDLRTFSIGFKESDLDVTQRVAKLIKSNHSELLISQDELAEVIPEVIYHLESFDVPLVRASLVNFLVAREAAKEVDNLLLSDGANELFGGYRYIESMNHEAIANEIVNLTGKLHNTTLQRIDRCMAAYGLTPLLVFLTPNVVKLALRIPARYKVYKGKSKWILREAMRDFLPDEVLMQTKSRNIQAIVGKEIVNLIETSISDRMFKNEKKLPNGWTMKTKEELFYYRIFVEQFGELENLSWMARTKETSRGEKM